MGNYNAIRHCQLCGKEFAGRRTSSRFCSKPCSTKATAKTRTIRGKCQLCGAECLGATVVICVECRQGGALRAHEERRFWSKVDKRGDGECWEWVGGSSDKDGYGVFYRSEPRGNVRSHRYSWQLAHRDPGDLLLLHTCDNRKCCNPGHLFLGTHQDNQADKVAKQRQARGEQTGHAKLNAEKVRAIRARLAAGVPRKVVADEFGIAQSGVAKIASGESWRHV